MNIRCAFDINENVITRKFQTNISRITVPWVGFSMIANCRFLSVYYNYAVLGRPSQLLLSSERTCVSMVAAVPTGYKNSYIMDSRDVWHLHSRFQMRLKVRVCVDTLRTNAWRSWPFMQVPKFINLSKCTSRRHKYAWSWWPPTCSHAVTHIRSNAAEIDCTAFSPRAWRSHSAICIGNPCTSGWKMDSPRCCC